MEPFSCLWESESARSDHRMPAGRQDMEPVRTVTRRTERPPRLAVRWQRQPRLVRHELGPTVRRRCQGLQATPYGPGHCRKCRVTVDIRRCRRNSSANTPSQCDRDSDGDPAASLSLYCTGASVASDWILAQQPWRPPSAPRRGLSQTLMAGGPHPGLGLPMIQAHHSGACK